MDPNDKPNDMPQGQDSRQSDDEEPPVDEPPPLLPGTDLTVAPDARAALTHDVPFTNDPTAQLPEEGAALEDGTYRGTSPSSHSSGSQASLPSSPSAPLGSSTGP